MPKQSLTRGSYMGSSCHPRAKGRAGELLRGAPVTAIGPLCGYRDAMRSKAAAGASCFRGSFHWLGSATVSVTEMEP